MDTLHISNRDTLSIGGLATVKHSGSWTPVLKLYFDRGAKKCCDWEQEVPTALGISIKSNSIFLSLWWDLSCETFSVVSSTTATPDKRGLSAGPCNDIVFIQFLSSLWESQHCWCVLGLCFLLLFYQTCVAKMAKWAEKDLRQSPKMPPNWDTRSTAGHMELCMHTYSRCGDINT